MPPPPPPPAGLGDAGRAAWVLAWDEASWLTEADAVLVGRLAELVDEVSLFREALLERGALLDEPLVSPRGDVVGTKAVSNPAAADLHRATTAAAGLLDRLGMSPASRARLGLVPGSRQPARGGAA